MAAAKRDIRSLIDSFSEDLIQIAHDIVRDQVGRSLSEWQATAAKNARILARKSAEEEKALRNQRALERIEKAAARRREREEKKAAERAARLEQRLTEGKKPRARRSDADAAKKEPTPPPLFVHKRRRDGEIEQLKRTDEAEPSSATLNGAAQPAAAAP